MNIKRTILIMLAALTGMVFYPAVVVLLVLGFLPTFGAFVTDISLNKSQVFCVGCCNGAGMVPIFMQLSKQKFSMQAAMDIIHDPARLLIVLVGAAVGWGIAFVVPMLTVSFYRARDQKAIQQLVARHRHLTKVWGDSIPELELPDQVPVGTDERPLVASK